MESKNKFIINELYGSGIFVYIVGIIQSIVAATETHEYWGRTETTFDFGLFLQYGFIAIICGTLLIGVGAAVKILSDVKEKIDTHTIEEGATKMVLQDLLKKGIITQDDYNRETMKFNFWILNNL